MSEKTCPDCGAVLTASNHSFGSSRCVDCTRVPLARSKAFFEKNKMTERDIQECPASTCFVKFAGRALAFLVIITLGAIIGYGNARSFGGLVYGFLVGTGAGIFFRWLASRETVNPLEARRWYHFVIAFALPVMIVWVFSYMGFMGTFGLPIGGSIFTHHIFLTDNFHIAAFWLVTLLTAVTGIIGAGVGYTLILRSDTKDKAVTLEHHRRWKEAKA